MRPTLCLAVAAALALGCASDSPPPDATSGSAAAAAKTAPEARSRTYRLGFWEFDLFALDLEPRGTTFRMLDIRIFKLLEVGGGKDYHSFSLVEMPQLFNVLTTRHEGPTHEFRVADVQALALALVRDTAESRTEKETHVLKVPVVGSMFGREIEGGTEKQMYLYVFRRELER